MKKILSKRGGFTMVELLVVIAIMAILMALAILAINTVRRQSRNTQLRNDAQAMRSALEANFAANRTYPDRDNGDLYTDAVATINADLDRYFPGGAAPSVNPSSGANTGYVCYSRGLKDAATGARTDSLTQYTVWVEEEGVVASGAGCTNAGYVATGVNNRYIVQ